MRWKTLVPFVCALFAGCAAYKELEPKPEVIPLERGYIELKNDKTDFELEKEKKYFIKFPTPARENFDLVLTTNVKLALTAYLTNVFDDGNSRKGLIPDEAASSDTVYVYRLRSRAPTFYWVIDTVQRNLTLSIRYRYVPEWRYTFETKSRQYEETLARNTMDRSTYNAIDKNFNFDTFDFARALDYLSDRTANIKAMKQDLLRLEGIIPPDLATSGDTAYRQFKVLRQKVDDELAFQDNYATVLTLFRKESETHGSVLKFLEAAPSFSDVLSHSDRFPGHIVEKMDAVLLGRLSEVAPYYNNLLATKNDVAPVSPRPSLDVVRGLYRGCGQEMPSDTQTLLQFLERYNTEAMALQTANAGFQDLGQEFRRDIAAPPPDMYQQLLSRVTQIKSGIPQSQLAFFGKYSSYPCVPLMSQELFKAIRKSNDYVALYQRGGSIASLIGSRSWGPAEGQVRQLFNDTDVLDPATVADQKLPMVHGFENQIFTGVKDASERRVDAFVKLHEGAIDNVRDLYQDSAFSPVYELTFSSQGPADLAQKKNAILSHISQLKFYEFPETAIREIYKDLTRNLNDRGVDRARAIVDHGSFYKGEDKQIRAIINECNPLMPKWIVKAKEYRSLFALPVSSNRTGSNEYMFRIRLNIPSEAQFPVFDVNLKLPQDLVAKASQQQWYDEITIDKKPIKNEGRFRITAPGSSNNYESQISPVEMDKEGNHILEVRFRYPGYRVFEVSAMAQVPIIRKN